MKGLRIHLKPTIFTLLLLTFYSLRSQPAGQVSGVTLGGSPDAPVKIEVFSDFQCPSCRELYLDVMRRTISEYCSQNKVFLVYHEFPLEAHRFSREAARYAEAVSRLGREQLLKVYDVLFMDQAIWGEDGKVEAAVAKVLSHAELLRVKDILQDPGINAKIDKEIKLGMQNKVTQTPTFFATAKGKMQKVEGRVTYILMKQYIDANLK